ncbi:MAG: hypothetical protein QOK37_1030 [Thermoanaerobaculia bacterium]|jgi:TRAP-type mannitol/chloroaromatic compound transport system permease small subunit|nr:hypothetical protein [Thermoanaerobaculia bacterium]
MAAESDSTKLQAHFTRTYLDLRIGIAIIGGALPLLLWLGERIVTHEPLRSSMSAYYYSPLMRDTFVGALISIGVFLYLYKGFSTRENWALNFAGLLAVGVALLPDAAEGESRNLRSTSHETFAVLFFLAIAYVCMATAADTLSLMRDSLKADKLKTTYKFLGIGMILFPGVVVLLRFAMPASAKGFPLIFLVEAVAVLTFSSFWLVKSYELNLTNAEMLAVQGKIEASPPPTESSAAPGRLLQVEPADIRDDPRQSGSGRV